MADQSKKVFQMRRAEHYLLLLFLFLLENDATLTFSK